MVTTNNNNPKRKRKAKAKAPKPAPPPLIATGPTDLNGLPANFCGAIAKRPPTGIARPNITAALLVCPFCTGAFWTLVIYALPVCMACKSQSPVEAPSVASVAGVLGSV
jgi:hypothetical protein